MYTMQKMLSDITRVLVIIFHSLNVLLASCNHEVTYVCHPQLAFFFLLEAIWVIFTKVCYLSLTGTYFSEILFYTHIHRLQ